MRQPHRFGGGGRPRGRRAIAVLALLGAFALTGASSAASASAATSPHVGSASSLPVNYDFSTGFVAGFLFPTTPPPGANDFSCKPSAAHPYPVVLVNGTLENMDDNWQAASPLLANHGYCVFTFNYGGVQPTDDIQAVGEIGAGARQLSTFVDTVLSATGASRVDLVGHSQGGMMSRYYLKFLGGAALVHTLVGLAPSNHGTTLDGLTVLGQDLGALEPANEFLSTTCDACVEQEIGSSFLTNLNAGGDTVPGVSYTVIETRDDEVVTPYTSALLSGPDVTNIIVQDQCPLDQSEHLEMAYDPIAMADMLNALDPSNPVRVPCVPVAGISGPVGPVPSF